MNKKSNPEGQKLHHSRDGVYRPAKESRIWGLWQKAVGPLVSIAAVSSVTAAAFGAAVVISDINHVGSVFDPSPNYEPQFTSVKAAASSNITDANERALRGMIERPTQVAELSPRAQFEAALDQQIATIRSDPKLSAEPPVVKKQPTTPEKKRQPAPAKYQK
jgi:hypothetical protein